MIKKNLWSLGEKGIIFEPFQSEFILMQTYIAIY